MIYIPKTLFNDESNMDKVFEIIDSEDVFKSCLIRDPLEPKNARTRIIEKIKALGEDRVAEFVSTCTLGEA